MKKEEKKREEDGRVDVTNDAEMVALGIRNPSITPRDSSVWTKTEKERRALKKWRHFKTPDSRWAPHKKTSGFMGRLIVNVSGLDKTTYSHNCSETDVPYLLNKYKSERSSIVKAFWNGKEIDPERLLKQAV